MALPGISVHGEIGTRNKQAEERGHVCQAIASEFLPRTDKLQRLHSPVESTKTDKLSTDTLPNLPKSTGTSHRCCTMKATSMKAARCKTPRLSVYLSTHLWLWLYKTYTHTLTYIYKWWNKMIWRDFLNGLTHQHTPLLSSQMGLVSQLLLHSSVQMFVNHTRE